MGECTWTRLFDTALEPQERDSSKPGHTYVITGRSVAALACAGPGDSAKTLETVLTSMS